MCLLRNKKHIPLFFIVYIWLVSDISLASRLYIADFQTVYCLQINYTSMTCKQYMCNFLTEYRLTYISLSFYSNTSRGI